ncbi:MAG: DinB family protein [Planctomycetes bacterium]|nr:DinB family protein [Planctomycetota bacterium]MBI3834699.1 DinB family protein [Planctomycetota bacterium]
MNAPATTIERGNTSAYQQKLANLLGSRDPLTVMAETADVLAKIVRENSSDRMKTRPFPGKWTPNEIIGHLSDSEWVYGYRMRLILCEDEPTILGMDQDLWVSGQYHNERTPAELVEMFRHLRQYNLFLWKYMREAQLKRVGKHNERGPESLGTMLKMNAGHDLSHIDQITRYLAAIK